jgi:hypothetical protein
LGHCEYTKRDTSWWSASARAAYPREKRGLARASTREKYRQQQQHHQQKQHTNNTTPTTTTATQRTEPCTCLHACLWVLVLVVGVGACVAVGGVVCCRWCNATNSNNTTNKHDTPTTPLQQQQ